MESRRLVTHNPPSKKIIAMLNFREKFRCNFQTYIEFARSVSGKVLR